MDIAFNREDRRIKSIEKVFLTKEERAALQSIIQLDQELKILVEDQLILVNRVTFNSDINEEGYLWKNHRFPIVWLNSPTDCKHHLSVDPQNQLALLFRTPKLPSKIKYDFPRVLISKHMSRG